MGCSAKKFPCLCYARDHALGPLGTLYLGRVPFLPSEGKEVVRKPTEDSRTDFKNFFLLPGFILSGGGGRT